MRTHTMVRLVAAAGAASLLITACSLDDGGERNDPKAVTIASMMGASDYSNGDDSARQKAIEEAVAM